MGALPHPLSATLPTDSRGKTFPQTGNKLPGSSGRAGRAKLLPERRFCPMITACSPLPRFSVPGAGGTGGFGQGRQTAVQMPAFRQGPVAAGRAAQPGRVSRQRSDKNSSYSKACLNFLAPGMRPFVTDRPSGCLSGQSKTVLPSVSWRLRSAGCCGHG